jgi:hypothetical protein
VLLAAVSTLARVMILGSAPAYADCPTQVTLNLPAGFCWIADNYLQGGNTVAAVLSQVQEDTTLYKHENA